MNVSELVNNINDAYLSVDFAAGSSQADEALQDFSWYFDKLNDFVKYDRNASATGNTQFFPKENALGFWLQYKKIVGYKSVVQLKTFFMYPNNKKGSNQHAEKYRTDTMKVWIVASTDCPLYDKYKIMLPASEKNVDLPNYLLQAEVTYDLNDDKKRPLSGPTAFIKSVERVLDKIQKGDVKPQKINLYRASDFKRSEFEI